MKKIFKFVKFIVIGIIALAVIGAVLGKDDKKAPATSKSETTQLAEKTESKETSQAEDPKKEESQKPSQSPAPVQTQKAEQSKPAETKQPESATAENKPEETDSKDAIRPELKAFLDSYEAFMDEYCDFLEHYNASDLSMLTKYMSLMEKELDFANKADAWEDEDMNDAETLYNLKVMNRVSEKLLKATQNMTN